MKLLKRRNNFSSLSSFSYASSSVEANTSILRKHKRTGRKNLGGGPTQSPLFAKIFARLGAKICPEEADF